MMFGFETRILERPGDADRRRLASFLAARGLRFEGAPEVSVVLEDPEGAVAATASLEGKVIRLVATDPEWQEAGLAAVAVSRLLEWARERGRSHLFVYTKPDAALRFADLGFRELARVDPEVVLLEMGEPGAGAFRQELEASRDPLPPGASAGAVVMNANPFTRGHRYLAEEARKRCDHLYLIVVETDRSVFPFSDRLALVRANVADLPGVRVVRSGDYAVSAATFPTYFLRDPAELPVARLQTRLDVTLFAELFVPALGLSRRFVGTEPYCPTTELYNRAMQEILPPRGVEFVEIPRLAEAGDPVSASAVREALRSGRWDRVRALVPDPTWAYLRDPAREELLRRIRESRSAH